MSVIGKRGFIGQAAAMAEEAIGTSDDTLTFPHLIKWAEMVTRAQAERAMGGLPVSSSQMFVLVLLHERGEATSAELSRMMRITPQALTMLIKPLLAQDFVHRRPDASHARRLQLRLAPKGNLLIESARSLSPGIEDDLLRDFTPDERSTLKQLLSRIARRFE